MTFRIKNYRLDGPDRYTTMTVTPAEFIRRFLLHTLPKGLHRIRHYGLFAGNRRAIMLAKARALLRVKTIDPADDERRREADAAADQSQQVLPKPCPCCGAHMIIVETFEGTCPARPNAGHDTS